MKSTGYAVSFLVIISFLFLIRRRVDPYFFVRGERVRAVDVTSDFRIDFWRLRISYASAEYERKLMVVQNNVIVKEFILPIDGGAAGDFTIAKNTENNHLVLFRDNLEDFIIDTKDFRAYRIWRSDADDPSPEVTEYSHETWGIYPLEPLSKLCVNSWVYIGTVGGPTGDLEFVTKDFVKLPPHISMSPIKGVRP